MKIRLTITTVIEYEPDPDSYPFESWSPEGMLAVDIEAAEEDPAMFMDMDEATTLVTGEVIKEHTP